LYEIINAARTRLLLAGHSGSVRSVAVSHDGQRALSGSDDDSIILWDLPRGEAIIRLVGHTGSVMHVDFSPDSRYALSTSNDNTLILWDVLPDSPGFGQAVRRFEGHTAAN
jgi:WD40 repeat protein